MDYAAAVEFVEAHIDYGTWAARSGRTSPVELSLDRMYRFVSLLGNPQHALSVIHVTGTNGKGSTSRIATRLLMAEGLRVATYSSPHLERYNERFRVNDVDIGHDDLAEMISLAAEAEQQLGERLMPFEVLTGAAMLWFAAQDVDVAVIEVGVLGRFDATNVCDGRVAVVTNIGFDHTNGTGDWQQRIAFEKAGIVKPGARLILGSVEPRLEAVFTDQYPSQIWRLGGEIAITDDQPTMVGRSLSLSTPMQTLDDLSLPLRGAHQSRNCALAVAAASAFLQRPLVPSAVTSGLAAVRMPARLEVVRTEPTVVLDGAHNPDAAVALARSLAENLTCAGRRTLIVGLLAGRDPAAMLSSLDATRFDRVITCTPPTARAQSAATLAAAAIEFGCKAVSTIDDIGSALAIALTDAKPEDQIVVTGSIYLVADARTRLSRT